MNVGILTIIDNNNYGNRLQNYATQKILEKMGINAKTLINNEFTNTKKYYLLRLLKHLNYRGTYSTNIKRRELFEKFNSNILFYDKKITAFSNEKNFDYCIVGSDQVWNPNLGRLRDVDMLCFVHPTKRIAFSASFGIDKIKNDSYITNMLEQFNRISVREDKGKEIVEAITGRNDVEVLIDPTMLLSSEEWDKISSKPEFITDEKYILIYFLGTISESRKSEIERIAKENNCKIINILDKDSVHYECGPSEFLWLEKNAFLICTDSFHSSVFAILYNRPFIIFEREQNGVACMNSRLETLISKFEINDRKYDGRITNKNLAHSYDIAYNHLKEERKKALNYLKESFNLPDGDVQ